MIKTFLIAFFSTLIYAVSYRQAAEKGSKSARRKVFIGLLMSIIAVLGIMCSSILNDVNIAGIVSASALAEAILVGLLASGIYSAACAHLYRDCFKYPKDTSDPAPAVSIDPDSQYYSSPDRCPLCSLTFDAAGELKISLEKDGYGDCSFCPKCGRSLQIQAPTEEGVST